MNRIAIKTFVLGLLLFACSFQSQTQAQEWARKMLTEYSHDFGEVNKGDMPEYRFEIKNIYKETSIRSPLISARFRVARILSFKQR